MKDSSETGYDRPALYKTYPDSRRVMLLPPEEFGDFQCHDFQHLLWNRKSVRKFSEKPLDIGELSVLLWASTGIHRENRGRDFRTVPSAGAQFPIETYIVVHDVTGLDRGVYHYNIKDHCLELLREGDFRENIIAANLGQKMSGYCPVIFVWTAIFARTCWRYGERGFRYIYLDAGHQGHALALAAHSLDMATTQIGAYLDDEVNKVIGVDGEQESTVYQSVVGYPVEE